MMMFKVVYGLAPNVKLIDGEFDTEYEALEAMYDFTVADVMDDGTPEDEFDDEVQLRMTYYAVVRVEDPFAEVGNSR